MSEFSKGRGQFEAGRPADPHAAYLSARNEPKRDPRENPDGTFDELVGADHSGEKYPSVSPGGLWAPKSKVGLNAIKAYDGPRAFEYDENGFPVGPGGLHYSGSNHEFSGGLDPVSRAKVEQALGVPGYDGPSYAQWLKEVDAARGRGARFKAKPVSKAVEAPVVAKAEAPKAEAKVQEKKK